MFIQIFLSYHSAQIEQHDQPLTQLDHSSKKTTRAFFDEPGRRLHRCAVDAQDLTALVHEQTDLATSLLGDDDARVNRALCRRHTEQPPQVDDRNDGAPDLNDAGHVRGRARDGRGALI